MVSEARFPNNWGYICNVVIAPDLRVRKRPPSLSTVAFSSLSDRVLLVAQNENRRPLFDTLDLELLFLSKHSTDESVVSLWWYRAGGVHQSTERWVLVPSSNNNLKFKCFAAKLVMMMFCLKQNAQVAPEIHKFSENCSRVSATSFVVMCWCYVEAWLK